MATIIHLEDSILAQVYTWDDVVAVRFDNSKTFEYWPLTRMKPFLARQLAKALVEAAQKAESHDRSVSPT